jgi:hypothetical protein
MAKRKPKPVPVAKPRVASHFAGLAVKIVLALVAVTGLLYGLGSLGEYAGSRVAGDARYQVPIADVQFDGPAYIDRSAFLTEVRLRSSLPETISSVDPKTPSRLQSAFRQHPWVADAHPIVVTPEGTLRAPLTFRKPALAIRILGKPDPRAVDATGVLLPEAAPLEGLPVLLGAIAPAGTKAGERHADPDVVRAAELVAIHPAATIERTREGWRIVDAKGKVVRIATP